MAAAGRTRGQAGQDRGIGPALLAAERAWDDLRRTYRALERQRSGSGEGIAAQAAEALTKINIQVSNPDRDRGRS